MQIFVIPGLQYKSYAVSDSSEEGESTEEGDRGKQSELIREREIGLISRPIVIRACSSVF